MAKDIVLVTGAAGYIGSVLCRQLLANGWHVRGLDVLLFGNAGVLDLMGRSDFDLIEGDLCDPNVRAIAVEGVHSVVHLAAIVGDPACKQYPDQATALMETASRALFESAVAAGVERFVFASTCSNYGQMSGDALLDEDAPLQPQSHYARLKVGFEEYLLEKLSQTSLNVSILRFATAYGPSPRMRFDLTVNHFTRDLALGQDLLVFGQYQWRPYCHVADLARAISLALSLPKAQATGIFNIGDSAENYSKDMIVSAILERLPQAVVRFGGTADHDSRNYRVDFSKAASQLSFQISKRVPEGIVEIQTMLLEGKITDPFAAVYHNS